MSNIEQIFAQFDTIDPNKKGGGGNYLPGNGVFLAEITAVRCKESDRGSGKTFYIIEFTLVESSLAEVKAGDGRAWSCPIEIPGKYNLGLRDVKRFIASAAGLDPASADALALGSDTVIESYGVDQPLVGQKVRVTTSIKGESYVAMQWDPA
jgi:hypothetical protein